jgi:hypothetical protein
MAWPENAAPPGGKPASGSRQLPVRNQADQLKAAQVGHFQGGDQQIGLKKVNQFKDMQRIGLKNEVAMAVECFADQFLIA